MNYISSVYNSSQPKVQVKTKPFEIPQSLMTDH